MVDWCSSGEGLSDSEDEDVFNLTGSAPKLQIRKNACKGRWDHPMGMAQVVQRRGQILTSTGILRNANTYCFTEEALFLAEVGALIIVDDDDAVLPLKDMYEKVAQGQSGCNWEVFQVYRHLKSLDYRVGQHGVPWTIKSIKTKGASPSRSLDDDKVVEENACKEDQSIAGLLSDLQINEGKIVFDVYRPNSKFSKSSPGDPLCVVSLAGRPPSTEEIEGLERLGSPLQFAQLEHGRVTFFSFDKVDLDVLP